VESILFFDLSFFVICFEKCISGGATSENPFE
jgi:hypothetical protein